MAPAKFTVYVDESVRQSTGGDINPIRTTASQHNQQGPVEPVVTTKPVRYVPDVLQPGTRFYFNERLIYPISGGECTFEELRLKEWNRKQGELLIKRKLIQLQHENDELRGRLEAQEHLIKQAQSIKQEEISLKRKLIQLQHENDELRSRLEAQEHSLKQAQSSIQSSAPNSQPQSSQHSQPHQGRLSIIPQSLQHAQEAESFREIYEVPSVIHCFDATCDPTKNTLAFTDKFTVPVDHDKFTVPVDQSQYIRENVPTSTPASKHNDENRKPMFQNNRRISRPSIGGGSPTLKLSPITETSRECNSKSSSSSSASASAGTPARVPPAVLQPILFDEPDRPIDPNNPTSYHKLLSCIDEPLNRRSGYIRLNRMAPKIRQGACFIAGEENYLVDKELDQVAKTYRAQLLNDDSNESVDFQIKNICIRFDQPANEWLYYICNELHRRLVRQATKPDIELSVMIANPAIIYNDASILIDEYFRYVSLQDFIDACIASNKPFPKSMAAYITLELIQLVRQMHNCNIIHMNITARNILITCCPTREDIQNVNERTSIVKLIGFDRAMDTRLLPPDFKFELKLEDFVTCQMLDSKPWTYEVDWFGVLNCIHKMFFLEDMTTKKDDDGVWMVGKVFKGYPTDVWPQLFKDLLNLNNFDEAIPTIDQVIDQLLTWVRANISFVLKEADLLDRILEDHCRANNKSVRV